MESSRRDHFNNMVEHRFILKINQYTYYSRFRFHPKQVHSKVSQVCRFSVRFYQTGAYLYITPPLSYNLDKTY